MNLLAAAKKTFCDSFAKLKHLAAFAVLASLVVAGPAVASVEGYRLPPGDIITFDFLDDAEIPGQKMRDFRNSLSKRRLTFPKVGKGVKFFPEFPSN